MFNLYFAGWGSKDADEYLQSLAANRLLSQANERRVINAWEASNVSHKLFIDSGAFSVAHAGKTVDIDDYIAYINSHPKIPIFVELDVIPFPVLNVTTAKECCEASWQNYLYMKQHVITDCTLLPLYHFGEPREALERILNTEVNGELANYIGIGGRHGVSTDAQCKYFNEVFTVIQNSKNPKVKVHAFGITVPKILESFPFYSADSTTWLQVAINGGIIRDDLSIVSISDNLRHKVGNVQNMHEDAYALIEDEVTARNYDFDKLCRDYKLRLRYNIDVMRDWAKNYTYKGPKIFKTSRLF